MSLASSVETMAATTLGAVDQCGFGARCDEAAERRRRIVIQCVAVGEAVAGRAGGGAPLRRIGNDDVRVGAAEAERADAGETRPVGPGKRHWFLGDAEVQIVEGNVGIEFLGMQRRRQQIVAQREARLQQADEAGCRLQVADIRLHRADRQPLLATLADLLADGARLDRVADARPGAVGFDERELVRIDAGAVVDGAQQAALRLIGRQRYADRPAVGVDAGRDDARVRVAIAEDRCAFARQHHDDAALAADIALAMGRERTAQPLRRQHPGGGEADERERVEQDVDAGHDGGVDGAGAQRRDGLVQGDERRRARGIDDEARAGKVEAVRDAVGDQRQRAAGHVVGVAARGIEHSARAVIDGRGADVDADRAAGDPGWRNAGVFERLPDEFEQQALLRVDLCGFARRDPEDGGVERPGRFEGAGAKGVGLARLALSRVQVAAARPAAGADLADRAAALPQDGPEFRNARRSGKSARITGNEDWGLANQCLGQFGLHLSIVRGTARSANAATAITRRGRGSLARWPNPDWPFSQRFYATTVSRYDELPLP